MTTTAKNLLRQAAANNGGVTPQQIRAFVQLNRRRGPPQTVTNFRDFLGVSYADIFIGIERDGYAHS